MKVTLDAGVLTSQTFQPVFSDLHLQAVNFQFA